MFKLREETGKKNHTEIKLVVFDLDGTLIDSHETIYLTVIHSLAELGITTIIDKQKFIKLLGHHFREMFEGVGVTVNDFDKFMMIYKQHYFDYISTSHVYAGVADTLTQLKHCGLKTALLTTKMQDQAELVSEYFELNKYFDLIMGRRDGIAHKPSPESLQIICKNLNIAPENSLMVGDTELDILCGKSAGSKTCAVTHGYRTYNELNLLKPNYIIDSIGEILQIVGVNQKCQK